MCDRQCICKSCIYSCSNCKYNEEKIDECRYGGIKECSHYVNHNQPKNRKERRKKKK